MMRGLTILTGVFAVFMAATPAMAENTNPPITPEEKAQATDYSKFDACVRDIVKSGDDPLGLGYIPCSARYLAVHLDCGVLDMLTGKVCVADMAEAARLWEARAIANLALDATYPKGHYAKDRAAWVKTCKAQTKQTNTRCMLGKFRLAPLQERHGLIVAGIIK